MLRVRLGSGIAGRNSEKLPDLASHTELGVCPDPHHLQRILTAPRARYTGAKCGRVYINICLVGSGAGGVASMFGWL